MDGLVASLPVERMERGIYEEELEEELEEASGILDDEADVSLLASAAVLGCDIMTGDRKVLASRFRKVKFCNLKEFR